MLTTQKQGNAYFKYSYFSAHSCKSHIQDQHPRNHQSIKNVTTDARFRVVEIIMGSLTLVYYLPLLLNENLNLSFLFPL